MISWSHPEWVDELIAIMQSEPVGNPPQEIYRYNYNGQTVYWVPAQCCDQISTLNDTFGETICAPDGDITGKRDGTRAGVFEQRTNEVLVWPDSRSRRRVIENNYHPMKGAKSDIERIYRVPGGNGANLAGGNHRLPGSLC